MVQLEPFTTRGLRVSRGKNNKYVTTSIMPGEKIIFTIGEKTISGELYKVGVKYIEVKNKPGRRYKHCYWLGISKYEISKIGRLAVFPKGWQKIKDIDYRSRVETYYN